MEGGCIGETLEYVIKNMPHPLLHPIGRSLYKDLHAVIHTFRITFPPAALFVSRFGPDFFDLWNPVPCCILKIEPGV